MLTIFLALILAAIAICPIAHFLLLGLRTKRSDIYSSIPTCMRSRYLQLFRSDDVRDDADPNTAFIAMYRKEYSWPRYIAPFLLFGAILLPSCWAMSCAAIGHLQFVSSGHRWLLLAASDRPLDVTEPDVALAGIAGAYLWIVADLIDGAWRIDLPPRDVILAALRLIVAAPLGMAVGSIVPGGYAPFIAFALGAFPLELTKTILRRIFVKILKTDTETDMQLKQVFKLDGVNTATADHLCQAGVTTVVQLARYDPVQLCMRTGLGFDFLLDLAGQSLAWLYFDGDLEKLRRAGLRGAGEIRNLYQKLQSDDRKIRGFAEQVVVEAAQSIGCGVESFKNACFEIAEDPYTIFLDEVWKCGLGNQTAQADALVLAIRPFGCQA